MNLRQFSIALLISAIPFAALADANIILNKGDFVAAEKETPQGETILRVKLSKSGKAKFKKLNANSVGQAVHAEIAGVRSDFKLNVPITGEPLDMGPYSASDAEKVIKGINRKE